MSNLKKINLADVDMAPNVFDKLKKQFVLISAGDEEKSNAMTANWGGFGILWFKEVVTIYVRPQRYTYEFTETHDKFAVTFLKPEYAKAHKVYGSKSGRDCDKEKETGLTKTFVGGVPTYEEAEYVLVCKKLYADDIKESAFIDKECLKCYDNDYHRMYIAEILEVYQG